MTESKTPVVVASSRAVRWVAATAAAWGFWYAIYRGYYALGGTAWLPGTISDPITFRLINAVAAAALLLAAVLPVATLHLWKRRMPRRLLLAACWVVAVGCVMHAIIDIVQQCLSLAGLLKVHENAAVLVLDPRAAALQDIFFNEPWFLVEGILFAVLASSPSWPKREVRRPSGYTWRIRVHTEGEVFVFKRASSLGSRPGGLPSRSPTTRFLSLRAPNTRIGLRSRSSNTRDSLAVSSTCSQAKPCISTGRSAPLFCRTASLSFWLEQALE